METRTQDYRIEGMTCASCVGRIERAVAKLPGVEAVTVNLATKKARVTARAGALEEGAVEAAVEGAGYQALPTGAEEEPGEPGGDPELDRDLRRATLLTLPLVALEMGGHWIPGMHAFLHRTLGHEALGGLLFLLSTLVLLGPGRRFFRTGLPRLLRGEPDMSTLVALGAGAAWAYSTAVTFLGGGAAYFESPAVVITLVLAGKRLEEVARGRASEAIARLGALRPATARVRRDGAWRDEPLGDVAPGDLVQVRPGESVPVDGVVVEGLAKVDESMLTGEAALWVRRPGEPVVGGTLNGEGAFTLRATRVGADSVLARIMRLVAEAQADKLPVQALVDRVVAWFVPAVLAIAAATFAGWVAFGPEAVLGLALGHAVAVLLIACPCAMGLATPMSILVGTGRGAELGVLFRRGDALERLGTVGVVAFDKTGTLTEGRPRVVEAVLAPGAADPLALVAALEGRSEHPLAGALVEAARDQGLVLSEAGETQARPGLGIVGTVGGKRLAVGSPALLEAEGIALGGMAEAVHDQARAGRTPVVAAVDGEVAAVYGVADQLRPGARAALARLRELGLALALVSGDDRRAAEAVAHALGIDEVVAGVRPEGKVAALERLGADGRGVAFVGDGINDAPALAAASVGIALGTGTGAALESAEVVLVGGELRGVATAIELSRATMANIRAGLFWAFAYNAALIPVATGAFGISLSPELAGLAMALSSLFVIANALRLRDFGAAPAGGTLVRIGSVDAPRGTAGEARAA